MINTITDIPAGSFINRLRSSNSVRTLGVAAGLCIALSACASEKDLVKQARKNIGASDEKAALDRISFEFMGVDRKTNDPWRDARYGDDCLDNTPYEPVARAEQDTGSVALLSIVKNDGERITATLTPSELHPDAKPLMLKGFEDYTRSLQPADEVSALILEAYGCPTE